MALLLTGNSLNADSAVSAGIFEAKVAASDLLATAQARARTLQGQPYDAMRKFRNFAQSDVPPYSADTARQIAHENGVADSDLDLYPAYLAIVNSVLRGSGLLLNQASDIEMREFLTLMFDPVAGNMMRTLFLNRQRADKVLRPTDELRIEHVARGVFSEAKSFWLKALEKSKLAHAIDVNLPADVLQVTDNQGKSIMVEAAGLQDAPGRKSRRGPAVVLTSAGAYGRVLEIVGASAAEVPALAALAVALSAMPYVTAGPRSMLTEMVGIKPTTLGDMLQSQALTALEHFSQKRIVDPEFFDVAACTANLSPAWSGGPFTWALQHQQDLAPQLQPALAKAWPDLLLQLEKAYG
jgi:3-hydroxyacyl-CoA dehydrogenase/enoyl-CoA hydratase/3-hydroxybutyryl-CoA epimerase